MKKLVILIIVLSGCVSMKQYKAMEGDFKTVTDAKKRINKEIRLVEKTIKLLEDSITRNLAFAGLLSTQIERRLAKQNIKVKLDPNDLQLLSIRNQDMDDEGFSYILKKYNFQDTNSAKKTDWLSPKERELMYWLNYARLNPKEFCLKYIYKKYGDRETNVYIATLMDYMLSMKPVPTLYPDKKLFESAVCHAETMGKAGLIGHGRQPGCKSSFSGECCSYGLANPLEIVIQLLIDQGVPSLGHRYICLGTYSKVGVSIKPHKSYGTNCVLDFGYGAI